MTTCSSRGYATDQHPCFSENAHHTHARMHLAVAPACNIQCHYCNRKYDCANESRPGVVSEVLTPQQAVRKVTAVKARIPQLSVVGIAGPGDPLANPRETFATCRLVRQAHPELMLCLSTNGLMLPQQVAEIAALGVHHVTITINALDPAIGARIYPWVFWEHRRLRGAKGAAVLLKNQLDGLSALSARGILVKINSVLIPGVNDAHLPEVHAEVTRRGAFMHNVMPLIGAPEHGTYYGLMGQANPTGGQLQAVREACGGAIRMMTHCRQCRADAVGMLDEDRHREFTLDRLHALPRVIPITAPAPARELTIAVASANGTHIDQHFGHAERFHLYRVGPAGMRLLEMVDAQRYCHGDAACGGRPTALQLALTRLQGCDAILCARIGFGPWQELEAAGITPVNRFAGEAIEAAVTAYWREQAQNMPAPVAVAV